MHLPTTRAIPRPALCRRAVAIPELNCSAVVHARTGIVDALGTVAAYGPCTAILRLNHRRRIEVVACINRLGEAQVLPLGPIERDCESAPKGNGALRDGARRSSEWR
jgi:hypothetical protein